MTNSMIATYNKILKIDTKCHHHQLGQHSPYCNYWRFQPPMRALAYVNKHGG
nr:unnamed protein product [Callosobruchus analis]